MLCVLYRESSAHSKAPTWVLLFRLADSGRKAAPQHSVHPAPLFHVFATTRVERVEQRKPAALLLAMAVRVSAAPAPAAPWDLVTRLASADPIVEEDPDRR